MHQPDNFGCVVPGLLYRGAQPTCPDIPYLQSLGVTHIISLREQNTDGNDLGAGQPFTLEHVPCECTLISTTSVLDFLRLVTQPGVHYVHCSLGRDRTGYMCAAYRMVVQGWTYEQADGERRVYGENPLLEYVVLVVLTERLRHLPDAFLRTQLGLSPNPGVA